MLSETLYEDLLSNALLGIVLIGAACLKDLCKRVGRSDCAVDENGLKLRLPTWRGNDVESDADDVA